MLAITIPKQQTVHVSYRSMGAFGEPYGNYTGNKLDNRKHGPAIAIAAAAGTISAGAAIGGFMGGMMIAGGIASGLGALTGNKTLSMLGMGLSAVGGIGSALTDASGNLMGMATKEGATSGWDAYNFGESALGKGVSKFSSFVSDITGSTEKLAPNIGLETNGINEAANGVVDGKAAGGWDGNQVAGYGEALPEIGGGNKLLDNLTGKTNLVAGDDPVNDKAKGGFLGGLLNAKDGLSIANGMVSGYNDYEANKQREPLIKANTNYTNAKTKQANLETQLMQQRADNMNMQNIDLGVTANKGANIYGNQTATAQNSGGGGKVAVVINGAVRYMTPQEYSMAFQNAQQQGGLLA